MHNFPRYYSRFIFVYWNKAAREIKILCFVEKKNSKSLNQWMNFYQSEVIQIIRTLSRRQIKSNMHCMDKTDRRQCHGNQLIKMKCTYDVLHWLGWELGQGAYWKWVYGWRSPCRCTYVYWRSMIFRRGSARGNEKSWSRMYEEFTPDEFFYNNVWRESPAHLRAPILLPDPLNFILTNTYVNIYVPVRRFLPHFLVTPSFFFLRLIHSESSPAVSCTGPRRDLDLILGKEQPSYHHFPRPPLPLETSN